MLPTPDPAVLVEAITSTTSHQDRPVLLHDRIADCLVDTHKYDKLTAFEVAEDVIDEVRQGLLIRQDAAQNEGNAWTVEVYGSEGEYIRGASFADKSLSLREQQIRAGRQHLDKIKLALQALSPGDFERACTAIIKLMGCIDPKTSRMSNDGGIDFYGRLELKGRFNYHFPYGGIDSRVGLWLVGQAKRYKYTNPVQTAAIRELVGSVELARTGGAIHTWEGLNLRPFDAVVHLFFTTGRFSQGVPELLEKSGIVSMDGDQLATFLADCGIGIDNKFNAFNEDSFRTGLDLEITPGEIV